jgi:protein TonB
MTATLFSGFTEHPPPDSVSIPSATLEENMFQETLLESSSVPKSRRGWSLITAFALESVVAAVLVLVPLLTTGMLPAPVSAPPTVLSFPLPTVEASARQSGGGPSGGLRTAAQHEVVNMFQGTSRLSAGPRVDPDDAKDPNVPPCPGCFGNKSLGSGPNLFGPGNGPGPVHEEKKDKRIVRSHMEDGELIDKVVPVYPSIARITGAQGEVKLHAIISREGRIESLTVVSGSPLLAPAAIDAVRQWRYRPYVLNGQPVEVDTWITVNFRRN